MSFSALPHSATNPLPLKILAIKFKLLGDVAVMVPALRALHKRWPQAQLHVLVREEAVPVLENTPWIHKVWGVSKNLSRSNLNDYFGTLRHLRHLRFDRSVDFEGNDRGAALSSLIGSRERLGSVAPRGFAGRRLCYTQTIHKAPNGLHEVYRELHTLNAWNIPTPSTVESEVHADPQLAGIAQAIFPSQNAILAHLSTSQPKKEWPVEYWAEIAKRAAGAGIPLFFSSGVSPREQSLLDGVKRAAPQAQVLAKSPNLSTFVAVIRRAGLFISGDTGPLHLAAGLGVPCIGIFGPSDINQWLPIARECTGLTGACCECSGHLQTCAGPSPCIRGVTIDALWEKIKGFHERASVQR